jgi:hypothetical protein
MGSALSRPWRPSSIFAWFTTAAAQSDEEYEHLRFATRSFNLASSIEMGTLSQVTIYDVETSKSVEVSGREEQLEKVWHMIWNLTTPTIEERRVVAFHPKTIGNKVPVVFHINQASRRIALTNYDRIDFTSTNQAVRSFALIIRLDLDNLLLNLSPDLIAAMQGEEGKIQDVELGGTMFDFVSFLHAPQSKTARIAATASNTVNNEPKLPSHGSETPERRTPETLQPRLSRWRSQGNMLNKIQHLTVVDWCFHDSSLVGPNYRAKELVTNIDANLEHLQSLTFLPITKSHDDTGPDTLARAAVLKHDIYHSFNVAQHQSAQGVWYQICAKPNIREYPCSIVGEYFALMDKRMEALSGDTRPTSMKVKDKLLDRGERLWALYIANITPQGKQLAELDFKWAPWVAQYQPKPKEGGQ